MKKPRYTLLVIFSLVYLAQSAPAHGWGGEAHRITGRIAEHYLSPTARDSIRALLGDETLPQVTTWADEIRGDANYNWARPLHYVNVDPAAGSYDASRDCPAEGCVVSAIEQYRQVLLSAEASRPQKVEALKFLAHFLGDIHQPLHCGYAADRGGNSIHVTLNGRSTNLHSAWDGDILEVRNPGWEEYARRLLKEITPEQQAEWQSSQRAEDWATQMFSIARDQVYKDENGNPIESGAALSDVYVEQSLWLIEQQLSMAGVRMGYFFNAVFDQAPIAVPQAEPAVLGDAIDPE